MNEKTREQRKMGGGGGKKRGKERGEIQAMRIEFVSRDSGAETCWRQVLLNFQIIIFHNYCALLRELSRENRAGGFDASELVGESWRKLACEKLTCRKAKEQKR
jgi:hypothetical protein